MVIVFTNNFPNLMIKLSGFRDAEDYGPIDDKKQTNTLKYKICWLAKMKFKINLKNTQHQQN